MKKEQKNNEDLRQAHSFLPLRPHRLISLWEMTEIIAKEVMTARSDLHHLGCIMQSSKEQNPLEIPNSANCADYKDRLMTARDVSLKLKMADSINRIERLTRKLRIAGFNITELYNEYAEMVVAFNKELDSIHFAFIPEDKLQYFEKDTHDALFGYAVFVAFPSSWDDIKSAGNCIALDLFDAAVFHLMLVVNNGLLALAKHINVAVGKKPLEYEEWHILIRKIDDELQIIAANIQNTQTAGTLKVADLEFYQGLSHSLKYIKDAHRNPIAHARGDYDESKAIAVFNDVRRFMERLATRVAE